MAKPMAKRRKAYHDYSNVYEVAMSQRDGNPNWLLAPEILSPNRAVFSAICGIISLRDEARKKELLGEKAYSRLGDLYFEIARGNTDIFSDVVYEATPKRYHPSCNPYEAPTKLVTPSRQDVLSLMNNPNYSERMVAARLRRELFPTTEEFTKAYHPPMLVRRA